MKLVVLTKFETKENIKNALDYTIKKRNSFV